MKKEQIKQAAAEFSKTRTMPPEGKRLYSFEELQAFAIQIHNLAMEEAAIAAEGPPEDAYYHGNLRNFVRDKIRALKVQP